MTTAGKVRRAKGRSDRLMTATRHVHVECEVRRQARQQLAIMSLRRLLSLARDFSETGSKRHARKR